MLNEQETAWSEEQDLLLAETVLRHTRNGSSLLKAFEEVGSNVSKTTNDCAVRWNATLKQKYKRAMEIADKQRQLQPKATMDRMDENKSVNAQSDNGNLKTEFESKVENSVPTNNNKKQYEEKTSFTVRQALEVLQDYFNNGSEYIEELKRENEELKEYIQKQKEMYAEMKDDYNSLVLIMQRARMLIGEDGGINRNKLDNNTFRKSI